MLKMSTRSSSSSSRGSSSGGGGNSSSSLWIRTTRPGGITAIATGQRRRGYIYGRRQAARRRIRCQLRCLTVAGECGRLAACILPPPLVSWRQIQIIQVTTAQFVQLAHVLLQIEVAAESLGADATRVGLLVVVRVHVEGEIVDLMERLVADVALVGLLAAVGQLVVLVVALLVEPLAAVLAHEGLVPGMDAGVCVEGGAAIEGLAAGLALVRLLGGVYDLVPAESRCLAKALATHLAHKRTGPCVHGHVPRQIVVRVEDLAALQAGEGLRLAAIGGARTAVVEGTMWRGRA